MAHGEKGNRQDLSRYKNHEICQNLEMHGSAAIGDGRILTHSCSLHSDLILSDFYPNTDHFLKAKIYSKPERQLILLFVKSAIFWGGGIVFIQQFTLLVVSS